MPSENTVHIVGPGTIGGPLTGLACDFRQDLGIDKVTFYKHTPRATDRPTIHALQEKGAQLAVAESKWDEFTALGLAPDLTAEQALEEARVVVDCTPVGLQNKERTYEDLDDGTRTFLAQGSEAGFGVPFALGVNDEAVDLEEESFVHVVSCNTHNISVLVKALGMRGDESLVREGRFVAIRRSSDVSDETFQPAPSVGTHGDRFGSHHARDVNDVYKTLGHDLDLFSSAVKVPTQYMHTIWFSLKLDDELTTEEALERLEDTPRVSFTEKQMANLVYSFGRDMGPYGRILAQTVVSRPTVSVRNGNEVVGFCFTPQDGNVLLTNLTAITRALHPQDAAKRLQGLNEFVLDEY